MSPQAQTIKSSLFFLIIACFGIAAWIVLAFPRVTILQLSIDRPDALRIAAEYLRREHGVEAGTFRQASIFAEEGQTNRYLQKALGREGAKKWFAAQKYEPFYWVVRFFKPGQKEEYRIDVSCHDGRILYYGRTIDDNAPRPEMSPEAARKLAENLLIKQGMDLPQYDLKDTTTLRRSNRVDYDFTWKSKNVDLRWSRDPHTEGAKLLVEAEVSGGEVLVFDRQSLLVPDDFARYLDAEQEVGRNISMVFYLIFWAIVITMMLNVVNTRYHLVFAAVKKFYYQLTIVLFLVVAVGSLSLFESVVMNYPTSQVFGPYLWRALMQILQAAFLIAMGFLIAGLAAEALRKEQDESRPKGSFLFYIRSTFFSQDILGRVLMGYATACGLLGLQAALFAVGERHFGVWSEEQWLTQFSNSYIPAIVALAMGLKASLTEEFTDRVFLLNVLKPWVKHTPLAVLLSAMIWGFGHVGYLVYPSWFRGLEVTILGVFLCWIYLRFGIIVVLVAHYLFNVFWASSGCLLGQVRPLYLYSSLGVILIPLFWGLVAFWLNKPETERPWAVWISSRQKFNRQVLATYVAGRMTEGADVMALRKECLNNGWDPVVVQEVFRQM